MGRRHTKTALSATGTVSRGGRWASLIVVTALVAGVLLAGLQVLYRTRGATLPISDRILWVVAVAAGLLSLAGLLSWWLGGRRRLALQRLTLYLEELDAATDEQLPATAAVAFPAGAGLQVGRGWNRLVAVLDTLRDERDAARAREQAAAHSSSYDAQRLQAVIDSLPDGVVVTDSEGTILLMNRSCPGKLGRDLSDAVGRRIVDLFDAPEGRDVFESLLNPRSPSAEGSFEWSMAGGGATDDAAATSGVAVTLRVTCYRLHRQRDHGELVVLLRDVTQQRVREASRESFLAHVSHELRSPLTNIRAYAETLLSDMVLDAAAQKEAFNVINEETGRLIRLVNDVLDLSQMESGSLTLCKDEVVTDRLVQQCVNDLRGLAASKSITLQTNYHPKLPNLFADREKLAVVLNNILSNAIKYTPQGGTVFVETNVDDSFVFLKVTDTGIGIAAEDQERVFEKFYRVDRTETAAIEGTGLGLATSKELVVLHGGTIHLSSELNKGTEITVRLPLRVKGPAVGLAAGA